MEPDAEHTSAKVRQQMLQLLTGYWASKTLSVTAELGVADFMALCGPCHAEALASHLGSPTDTVARLLRALQAMGVVEPIKPDEAPVSVASPVPGPRYGLTSLGRLLDSADPSSLNATARVVGDEFFSAWTALSHSIRTGEPAFQVKFGGPLFAHLADGPAERALLFDRAMEEINGPEIAAILSSYRFEHCRHVMDIGGGNGGMLDALLSRHPMLHGTLFDRPQVVAGARDRLARPVSEGRCSLHPGDFFLAVPSGPDMFLLRHILHDWADREAVTILRRVARAMRPGARLLIVEDVMPEAHASPQQALLDLHMLAVAGGQERTIAQYQALLSAGGLCLAATHQTPLGVTLLEAVLG